MALIEVRRVTKEFLIPSVRRDSVREHVFDLFRPRHFDRLRVLDAIGFSVARGETVGIMGRNGSGKSTLLKVLCGIYPPDSGEIAVGAPVTPILELGVGWNPNLTAVDNVYLIGTVLGLSLKEIRHSLEQVLAFAELERFANLELRHFSSGMAARLAYAVAFRAAREIVMLDEIFAVGDAGFKRRCMDRYRELQAAGHTILLVSHAPDTIVAFCQRAILLEAGRIMLDADAPQVADAYLSLLESSPGTE
jgi:ABC-type polysaccharide/polyol phosphate transport system ATPase subunit